VVEENREKPKQRCNFSGLVDFLESGSEFEPDDENATSEYKKSKPRRVVSSDDEVMSEIKSN